jgi:hypothetical protein
MGIFALDGRDNITAEEHFGIKGFMATAGVPYRDVLSVSGLWAPPYAATDFMLEVRLCGEKVPTDEYEWEGNACRRTGRLRELRVESDLVLPMEKRCGLLEFTVTNAGSERAVVPVQLVIRGGVAEVSFWEFSGPGPAETGLPWAERAGGWKVDPASPNLLVKMGERAAIAVATDLDAPVWETLAGHWEASLTLDPGEAKTVRVGFAIGPDPDPREMLVGDPVADARREWAEQVDDLYTRMPRLEASDPRLVRFYDRSMAHLLLNQWRVPDLVLDPYYSTGGMKGGCVCCYLWDFGEPWEMLPLYDPAALRTHIKQFLSIDITQHFAFVPTTGEAFGPWYPVNQEKILHLLLYYVRFTGDVGFLAEEVAGKTILAHVLQHAMHRDDPTQPVGLINYGKGNNHLELRGTYRYDYYLPDLNARRYTNYLAAYELSKLAGEPAEDLPARAEALKGLIKEAMWSREDKWFFHLDEDLQPDLRWTVQMFKLIASEVLDEEELDGLIGHLNEDEFLSAYGLHSMSKLDPAFDQEDIDNGGGGNYTAFTPRIIELLYRAGRTEVAEDLFRRILWWGERMPYWGDSIVANNIDYRRDTPLQNTIGAVAGAQSIIFGMLGVQVRPDGAIVVDPRPPSFSPELRLTGLRLRGRCIDVAVSGKEYTVVVDGEEVRGEVGQAIVVANR